MSEILTIAEKEYLADQLQRVCGTTLEQGRYCARNGLRERHIDAWRQYAAEIRANCEIDDVRAYCRAVFCDRVKQAGGDLSALERSFWPPGTPQGESRTLRQRTRDWIDQLEGMPDTELTPFQRRMLESRK